MRYQFEYELTEEDYLEFNKFHTLERSAKPKNHVRIRLCASLIMLISVAMFLIDSRVFAAICLVFSLAFFIISIFGTRIDLFFIKSAINAMKKEGKLPYGKNNLLQFHEEFIMEFEDEDESKFKYITLEQVVTGNCAIYIYRNAITAIILPFSAFESKEQRNEFLRFINDKMNRAIERTK